MASRYGKNPIKGRPAKAKELSEEQKVNKARQRSKGSASHKSASQAQTRNEPTNARGGNKPVSKEANVKSTKGQMKRALSARKKDMANAASKSLATTAGKKAAAKAAGKLATRAIPVVGTAMLAKDAYDAVKADGKRTSKGGQMSRKKASPSKQKAPDTSTSKSRTDKMKKNKKPSK